MQRIPIWTFCSPIRNLFLQNVAREMSTEIIIENMDREFFLFTYSSLNFIRSYISIMLKNHTFLFSSTFLFSVFSCHKLDKKKIYFMKFPYFYCWGSHDCLRIYLFLFTRVCRYILYAFKNIYMQMRKFQMS